MVVHHSSSMPVWDNSELVGFQKALSEEDIAFVRETIKTMKSLGRFQKVCALALHLSLLPSTLTHVVMQKRSSKSSGPN
jgi:hypothetical protein